MTLAFVDVPGHERFVKTMLAGAGGIDAVVLVVAADESVKPQTREHFDICRLLGIERGLVALTKSDLVDRDTIELVTLEVRDLVAGSFLAAAPVIPVSARTGDGLPELTRALTAFAGGGVRLGREGVVRLPVDRAFTMKGFGTVVTGTLVSGRVAEGDELAVLPDGRAVRVRGVQVHGRPAAAATAPSRAAVNLGHVDVADVARGVTLATAGSLAVTTRVDLMLELLPGARPLKHGGRVRLHHGTSEVLGRVSICATRARDDDAWRQAKAGELGVVVPPAGQAYMRVRLERPAVLTRGDRVVLRAYSPPVTIGGGMVLDPEPAASGVRRTGALARFTALANSDDALRVFIRDAGARGVESGDLVRRGGLGPSAAQAFIDRDVAARKVVAAGTRFFDRDESARLDDAILKTLSAFHAAHPLDAGMPREALRDQVAAQASSALFDAVLADLSTRAMVRGSERVARADHRPAESAEDIRVRDAVIAAVRAGGLTPPDASCSRGRHERLSGARCRRSFSGSSAKSSS